MFCFVFSNLSNSFCLLALCQFTFVLQGLCCGLFSFEFAFLKKVLSYLFEASLTVSINHAAVFLDLLVFVLVCGVYSEFSGHGLKSVAFNR